MALASSWEVWFPIVLFGVLILLLRGGFKLRACCLTAAAILGFNDGVVARTLKRAADRPRPHQVLQDVRIVDLAKARPRLLAIFHPPVVKRSRPELTAVVGRSFPSSHAVNLFSAALVAACFYGRRAAWGFALAALVAYSRIYVGSHWPSDILVSMFLGLGSTLCLLAALDLLWRRSIRRWPALHARHPSLFTA